MSARICQGFHICMCRGQVVEGVWSIMPETARVQAEERLKKPWDELEKEGYALVKGEFWTYP